MFKLNGVEVSAPKPFKVDISDLDGESNRNALGDMTRDRVAVKRKINLEWPALSQAKMSEILNAVSPVFIRVDYIDPQFGQTFKTMYVSDRSAGMYMIKDGEVLWEGLSCSLVEK